MYSTMRIYIKKKTFCGEKDGHVAACYNKNSVNILVD
jgi:hypothetical protein